MTIRTCIATITVTDDHNGPTIGTATAPMQSKPHSWSFADPVTIPITAPSWNPIVHIDVDGRTIIQPAAAPVATDDAVLFDRGHRIDTRC